MELQHGSIEHDRIHLALQQQGIGVVDASTSTGPTPMEGRYVSAAEWVTVATRRPSRSEGLENSDRSSLTANEEAMAAVKLAKTRVPRAIHTSASRRPLVPLATLSPYPTVLMVTTDQ